MKSFLLLFSLACILVFSPSTFGQNSKSVYVSLPRWQAASPVQVVGSGFGRDSMIDDVFVFNSSATAVSRIRLAGQVFAADKRSPGVKDCLEFLESAPIEISVPPLKVVHIKNIALWTASDLAKAFRSSKSGELVIRLGILSSVSETGLVFESNPKESPFFELASGEEKNGIDLSWEKFGSKQLIEIANAMEPSAKEGASSIRNIVRETPVEGS